MQKGHHSTAWSPRPGGGHRSTQAEKVVNDEQNGIAPEVESYALARGNAAAESIRNMLCGDVTDTLVAIDQVGPG